ncbi:MAG TPA: hypothetical protein VFL64_13765 [Rhizobacter sp.]|nr:hypothetical protein [Rhizobacter sp.]
MAITAETVQGIAKLHPDGVSIDLNTGRILTGTGFCVAYAATQDNHNFTGLQLSMQHALGPSGSGIIGAWTTGPDTYYDSVKKYITRESAVQAAIKEEQIAVYNLQAGKVENIMTPLEPGDPKVVNGSPGSFNPALATGRKRAQTV